MKKNRPGQFYGKRYRPRRSSKLGVGARISPALYDTVLRISESERRTFPEVAGALMLLGAGVWRRLCEHPHIRKGYVFQGGAELLLLSDIQTAAEFFKLQEAMADAVVARSHRFGERSEYYK